MEALPKLLEQLIYGDFCSDNANDLALAIKARGELFALVPALSPVETARRNPPEDSLVIPGKKWGWFNADMTPIATGDNWHKLSCPMPSYEPVPVTDFEGTVSVETQQVRCPIKSEGAKREVCAKCKRIFIYP
jgi:hypothetical protein